MSVILFPLLTSKPLLANAIAARAGGVWVLKRGLCVLEAKPVRDLVPAFLRPDFVWHPGCLTGPDDPAAA